MSEKDERHSEETIRPIKPGLTAGGLPAAAEGPAGRRPGLWLTLAGALLLATALAVFLVLPRLVGGAAERAAQAAAAAQPTAQPQVPQLSPAERAKLKAAAEDSLSKLLPQQAKLKQRSAASWGQDQWKRYQALSKRGDDAYLAEDYGAAVAAYEKAAALGARLLQRSGKVADAALAAGRAALDAGQPELARKQFGIVLSIDKDNKAAQAGRDRAAKLPKVLAATQRGDGLRGKDELEAAARAYRRALALDPKWQPARDALAAVTRQIGKRRFERLMSDGGNALGNQDFAAAKKDFEAALKLRPKSSDAKDGLVQAEQGRKLHEIALAKLRATAFERRELWDRAIEQYQAALDVDPTLDFAREGLKRARARADLDVKLNYLIGHPRLLFRDGVLADARRLLAKARAKAQPKTRIAAQVARLGELIHVATTPVSVELRSDDQTEVTVYKVGKLGSFMHKQIKVRPGTYTALGSRDGYRDVRKTFTVLPGNDAETVDVVCMEPI
jgi:hypothetical protein